MNVVIKSTSIDNFCRVCFQSTTELVSCCTFIKNASYTITDILNLISHEPYVS